MTEHRPIFARLPFVRVDRGLGRGGLGAVLVGVILSRCTKPELVSSDWNAIERQLGQIVQNEIDGIWAAVFSVLDQECREIQNELTKSAGATHPECRACRARQRQNVETAVRLRSALHRRMKISPRGSA